MFFRSNFFLKKWELIINWVLDNFSIFLGLSLLSWSLSILELIFYFLMSIRGLITNWILDLISIFLASHYTIDKMMCVKLQPYKKLYSALQIWP